MDDVGGCFQWDTNKGLAKLQAQPVVHHVIHHPQCGFRNAGRKLPQFDAVELIHVHLRQVRRPLPHLPPVAVLVFGIERFQDLDFQQSQFPVGDDEKVAAATGGIKKREPAQLGLKLP